MARRGHLQAAPPPPRVAGEPAPGPGVNAPSVAAVSTLARSGSVAAGSKVFPVEVQKGAERRVKRKQFRAPIAPMAVKSLGMRLMLSHLGSPSCARVRSPSTAARHVAQPPELMDDVTAEILLRLPPDEPEHLFRASVVCKRWLRILTDPDFRRRYQTFHRTPPLLGLLYTRQVIEGDAPPRLCPTTAVPLTPNPYFRRALDCHHGRVLLHLDNDNFTVWEPATGDQQHVPDAGIDWLIYSAAVFCAVRGCNHIDCHGGPFLVVFLATEEDEDVVKATVYSSERGAWSTPVTLGKDCEVYVQHYRDAVSNGAFGRFYVPYVQPRRGAVIGNEIFFTLRQGNAIVKYDLGKNCLSMINPPSHAAYYIALMEMEDNALGFACIQDWNLHLWSRQLGSEGEGAAVWVQSKVIKLQGTIPVSNPDDEAVVVGYAEGVRVLFVSTDAGLFTFERKSGQVRKVDEPEACLSVLPYMSFYTCDRARFSLLASSR